MLITNGIWSSPAPMGLDNWQELQAWNTRESLWCWRDYVEPIISPGVHPAMVVFGCILVFSSLNVATARWNLDDFRDDLYHGKWVAVSSEDMSDNWPLVYLQPQSPALYSPENIPKSRVILYANGTVFILSLLLLIFLLLLRFNWRGGQQLKKRIAKRKLLGANKEFTENLDKIYESMVQIGQGMGSEQGLMRLLDYESIDLKPYRLHETAYPCDFQGGATKDGVTRGQVPRYLLKQSQSEKEP